MTLLRGVVILTAVLLLNQCSKEPETTPSNVPRETAAANHPLSRFTAIHVDSRTERIELFLHDDSGKPFRRLDRLASWLDSQNRTLRFAMNAGMYEPDLSPVGLFIQNGQQLSPLNLSDGTGNFYLKPNGVFLISSTGPRIVESSEYPSLADSVRLATQSGPLLVREGVLHPAFNPNSASKLVRNGVGVRGDRVVFVISEVPVNFYEMAIYFRDSLECSDALYLDGVVSSLYSTEQRRNDARAELGPMIGVID